MARQKIVGQLTEELADALRQGDNLPPEPWPGYWPWLLGIWDCALLDVAKRQPGGLLVKVTVFDNDTVEITAGLPHGAAVPSVN
jgi:hypothetical protein